jgi:hypothetical protein
MQATLLFLAERGDEGLHVDQVTEHQAFFEEAGAQVVIEALHRLIRAPIGLRLVIDAPAQGFGRILYGGRFDEDVFFWKTDESEERDEWPFADLDDAERARKLLEAIFFRVGSVNVLGQTQRECL